MEICERVQQTWKQTCASTLARNTGWMTYALKMPSMLSDKEISEILTGSSKGGNVLTISDEMSAVSTMATESTDPSKLTNGSLLTRNTVWNLVGQVTPMAVGLIAIPHLVHALGTDRFGVLTIAWMVVGYFSFFDLGLGRAMTNLVAQKLATKRDHELPAIIWTANLLMGAMGILGAIVLVFLSPLLVQNLLKTPPALQVETTRAFYLLSLSVPFVISTAGFRGVLEARQKFGIINVVRIPMGIATFAAPLLVLPWSKDLTAVVGILVVMRILFWSVYTFLVLRDIPILLRRIVIDMHLLPMLFSFGAWMTVSNVVSPIMAYLDRFLVGTMLSLTAVAYYATPFEIATKMSILPMAIVGVLFPAFSTALVVDHKHAGKLFQRAVKYVVLALLPLTLLIVLFAQNFLSIWLGSNFASHSTHVLQILAIGVFVNGMAALPFALVQGAGRADITGKLHLFELPFYLVTVWTLTRYFGIEGTALAWTIRVITDAILLFWATGRFVDIIVRLRSILVAMAAVAAMLALTMIDMSLPVKILVAVVSLLSFAAATWFAMLAADERIFILNLRFFLLPSRFYRKVLGLEI
jgi:O-antigen/teichoic acid export membrane protein